MSFFEEKLQSTFILCVKKKLVERIKIDLFLSHIYIYVFILRNYLRIYSTVGTTYLLSYASNIH